MIYGGAPVLLKTQDSSINKQVETQKQQTKAITKYSWLDEDAKVKIYIDFAQFGTEITAEMITVNI